MNDTTQSEPLRSGDLLGHLWIVEGSSGEYSDRRDWVVCAYRTEEEAKRHAERAQARSEELRRKHDTYWDIPAGANEWDPQESHDCTGTRYTHSMTELRSLPNDTDQQRRATGNKP